MGAFEGMNSLLKGGVQEKARELGYPPETICILDGDIDRLKAEFPECYANLQTCTHNRDSRTPIQYAQDLVASWVFEDTMAQILNAMGIRTTLSGADRGRKLLSKRKVSSASDCLVEFEGKKRSLEIVTDYTGWWHMWGTIELRDSKWLKIRNENSLLLGVCICKEAKKYFLVDGNAMSLNPKYIPSHRPYGGKPAYSFDISNYLMKLDFVGMASKIKALIALQPSQ